MAKFVAGLLIGLLLGTVAEVGSDPHLSLSWASSSISIESFGGMYTGPTSFVFAGKGSQELLQINQDGTVTYQGRVLGTDKEVWDGLRAVFNPWRVCQEMEEDVRWVKP